MLEEFLGSTAGLMAGISALLGSLAALTKALADYRNERAHGRDETTGSRHQEASPLHMLLKKTSFALFVALGLVAGIILIPRVLLPEKPTVRIDTPFTGQSVEVQSTATGPGLFIVSGSSSAVYERPDLRLYVLVHPSDPYAAGWWIQRPALVDASGSWTSECLIGNPEFPPHVGDKVDVVGIATDHALVGRRVHVDDPKDLRPVAQSGVVRFSIRAIQQTSQ